MSVPIIYDSCLSDEALDSAITDYLKVTAENERLDKELEIHEADQQQKADTAAANGEAYEKEVREVEHMELQPFNVTQKKFLICIDTMGQDCEISDERRRAVLETITIFKAQWERAEVQCLTADRDRRIELMSRDPQIEAEIQEKATETISKVVEDLLAIEVPEGTVVDEEQKQLDLSNLRLTTQSEFFKPTEGIMYKSCMEIAELNVIKMPRIIQSLMFLMQIDHDAICEPDSNRLFWKSAKKQMKDLCQRISEYKMLGEKAQSYKGYQTINYCEKLINDYTPEDVE